MATRKQKHAKALAKRERSLAAERKIGLDALERARQIRAEEAEAARQKKLAPIKKRSTAAAMKSLSVASKNAAVALEGLGEAFHQGDDTPIDLTRVTTS